MSVHSETYETPVADVYPSITPENFKGLYNGRGFYITGGGSGLGLASAKAYAQSGAKIFIVGRRLPVSETAKSEIEALGAEVGFAQVDVMQRESIVESVQAAVEKFGKIDVVICNAGGWVETGETHAPLPGLIKTGNGYVVFLSSNYAQIRGVGHSAYNVSKHALNRFTEYIEIENRDAGVKASSLHPGVVDTDLSRRFATQYGISDTSKILTDTPELDAWTQVRLTSGREDWLSGRYFAAPWGFDQIEPMKEGIIAEDAHKNRLALA